MILETPKSVAVSTMGDYKRVFDIELTNRCNALCTFCPRDETPDQGFMNYETFQKCLSRAEELGTQPNINSTGQGEPLLHPDIVKFANHARERGLPYSITTNASLMTTEMAEKLIDAGMHRVNFSISDMGADYEEVYALNFNNTRKNIMNFLDLNKSRGNPVKTMVNVVKHDLNAKKIEEYRKFWLAAGIDSFLFFDQSNRGGACEHGHYFLGNDSYKEEALKLFRDNQISRVCGVPYIFVFVGWSGQYYICCNDYKKTTPLGSIFDHSIEAMDVIKKDRFCASGGIEACNNCNMDPLNKVRELLFEINEGESKTPDLEELLEEMKTNQAKLPPFARPL